MSEPGLDEAWERLFAQLAAIEALQRRCTRCRRAPATIPPGLCGPCADAVDRAVEAGW